MTDLFEKPKGLIFDLNGTMIDDMQFHSQAWHSIINDDLGKELSFEEVKKQMYGKNEELLVRVFGEDHFTKEQITTLSKDKELRYQKAFKPYLALINGLDNFLARADEANILMAIGSAAIPFNIDFVLDGLNIRKYFSAIVSADDVNVSKPNPETFLNCATALNVPASGCIVFEDVPKGVEAAANAGMKCFVVTTTHSADEFNGLDNILGFITDFKDPILKQLF